MRGRTTARPAERAGGNLSYDRGVRRGGLWIGIVTAVAVAAAAGTVGALQTAGTRVPGVAAEMVSQSSVTSAASASGDPMIPAPPIGSSRATSPSPSELTPPTPTLSVPPSVPPSSTPQGSTPQGSTPPAPTGTTGVAADCNGPTTDTALSQEPATIVIACADDGIGLQDLTWTSWGATSATGTGTLWLNLCTPDCATGQFGHYPASVTLSSVVDSAKGPVFTVASLTYPGAGPTTVSGQLMSRFTLWHPGM